MTRTWTKKAKIRAKQLATITAFVAVVITYMVWLVMVLKQIPRPTNMDALMLAITATAAYYTFGETLRKPGNLQ